MIHTPKIIFAELAMSGVYHSVVNASMIEVLKLRYPDYKVYFYGSKSHIKAINDIVEVSVVVKSLPFFPKPSLKTLLLRDFLGIFYSFFLLCRSKKKDLLFFTYILPATHWTIFLLNKILKRRICIMLHGQVEAYVEGSSLRGTKKYFNLEKVIYKHDYITTYFILGEVIHDKIKHIFGKKSKIAIINHPYKFKCVKIRSDVFHYPIHFAQVGVGNKSKGSDLMFDLSLKLKDLIESGKVKLSIIGKIDPTLSMLDNGLVDYFKDFVPAQQYEQLLSQLHYTLLLRNKEQGQGVASGSFLDTLTHCKPYISLKNNYVSYYQSIEPLSGILCDDITQLENVIRSIVNNFNEERYNESCQAIVRLRSQFKISQIASQIADIEL